MFEGMCNIEIQNTKILDIKINATILALVYWYNILQMVK